MNDDPQQALLTALAQHYGDTAFSARDAAATLPALLWQAAGVPRPDANACGRWLRARRGPGLTGKPNRAGVVQWRVRGATGPAAALQGRRPSRPRSHQRRPWPSRCPSATWHLRPSSRPRRACRRPGRSLRRPSSPGGLCPTRRPVPGCPVAAGDAESGGHPMRRRRRDRPAAQCRVFTQG